MSIRLLVATGAVASLFGVAAVAQTPQPTTPTQPAPQSTQPAPTQPGTTAQPGVRAIDPATLKLTYYTVQPADMLAENLIDADVYNLQNEEVGEIDDLIIDDGKRVTGVILEIGGFLGLGERHVAVDPASLVINRGPNGSIARVVINTTKENLKNAPAFKFEGNMRRSD